MTNLAHFVRLDLFSIRPYLKSMVLMVAIVTVLVTATASEPMAALPALMVLGAMFPAYPFSLDERAHLDTLYAALPVSRGVVVVGRYLTLLILFGVVALTGVALVTGIAVTRDQSVPSEVLLISAAVGFAAYALVMGAQVPIYFAIGFTRARPLSYLPMAVLGLGVAGLTLTTSDDWTPPEWLMDSPATLSGLSVLVGILALAVSAGVSRRVYAARAL